MPHRSWLVVLTGAVLLWFAPLGSYHLFNPDEGRYAEIPREILDSGDWVTPRLDGIKYFEKPPLHYWATAAAFKIFGASEWSARLFVALSGFLGLLLTAWCGTRLYGAQAGALAALVQGGALLYLGLARISTLDMGLTVALELALVGLVGLVAPPPVRAAPVSSAASAAGVARHSAVLLALGVALAFLAKGLIGILIPGAVAALYLLLRRDWALAWRARPWWTLAALALIALPWVWLVSTRNPEFARFFFIHEHFERFLTRVHARYEPDWFFVPVLLLGFMPWTVLLPAAAARAWRACRAGEGATWMLVLWALFGFVFFSLSQSKLVPYILPVFPALALLTGRAIDGLPPLRLGRALMAAAGVWAALGLASLVLWRSPAWSQRLEIPSGAALPAIVGAFLLAALLCALGARWARRRGALAAVMAAALGSLLLLGVILPAADTLPRQREITRLITATAPALRAGTALYCVDDYEQSISFYLRRPCTLVGYRGELDFGLQQEPGLWIADLGRFAARWRAASDAVAVVRRSSYLDLQRMGLPMRVLYTAPSLVAVARQ